MNEDWIPSLESESGYTDIWLAVDSLISDSPSTIAMEAQVYVNDLAGGVGVGILKVLEKAMQNTVKTYRCEQRDCQADENDAADS